MSMDCVNLHDRFCPKCAFMDIFRFCDKRHTKYVEIHAHMHSIRVTHTPAVNVYIGEWILGLPYDIWALIHI